MTSNSSSLFLVSILAFIVVGCSSSVTLGPNASLYGQTPEQNCEIIVSDSVVFQGTGLRVESDSVFWTSDDQQLRALPRSNVKAVQFIDHAGGFMTGMRAGLLCGLGSGLIFTQVRFGGDDGEDSGLIFMAYIYIGGLGAAGGALTGGIVGGIVGNTETYVLSDSTSTSTDGR
jgi:hypothetical protein